MENPYADVKDLYGPDNDFFRAWKKDDQGRDCLVGLDYEESQEFERLRLDWLADRTVPSWRSISWEQRDIDGERLSELMVRHERARHARLLDPADIAIRLAEFKEHNRK